MPAKTPRQRRILARTAAEAFVGRGEQLRALTSLGTAKSGQQGILLFAAPQSGVSELLRQAFDELFRQRGGPAPVYFAFSRTDAATTSAARRFLQTFLTQVVAHRRDDPALVSASPTLRANPVAVQPGVPNSPTENVPASVSCRNDGTTRAISVSRAPSRRHTAAVVRVVPTSTPSTYAKSLPHLFAAATSTYTGE